jgi:hypothetical protein
MERKSRRPDKVLDNAALQQWKQATQALLTTDNDDEDTSHLASLVAAIRPYLLRTAAKRTPSLRRQLYEAELLVRPMPHGKHHSSCCFWTWQIVLRVLLLQHESSSTKPWEARRGKTSKKPAAWPDLLSVISWAALQTASVQQQRQQTVGRLLHTCLDQLKPTATSTDSTFPKDWIRQLFAEFELDPPSEYCCHSKKKQVEDVAVVDYEAQKTKKRKVAADPNPVVVQTVAASNSSQPWLVPPSTSLVATTTHNSLLKTSSGRFVGSHFNSRLVNTASLFHQVPARAQTKPQPHQTVTLHRTPSILRHEPQSRRPMAPKSHSPLVTFSPQAAPKRQMHPDTLRRLLRGQPPPPPPSTPVPVHPFTPPFSRAKLPVRSSYYNMVPETPVGPRKR